MARFHNFNSSFVERFAFGSRRSYTETVPDALLLSLSKRVFSGELKIVYLSVDDILNDCGG